MNRRLTIADLPPSARIPAPPPQTTPKKLSGAERAAANDERLRIKKEKAKQRRERLWAINLDRLQQAYPEIFDAEHPKPLAIGCKHAIRAEFGWRASKGLGHWTHRTEYLRALAAPDAQRHSLDGTPIEPVSAEHREYALRLLEDAHAAADVLV